jgi:hypothetical protein
MILILGSPTDILASDVNRRLSAEELPVYFACETALFTTVPFAFERSGRDLRGFLRLNGDEISLTELSGVLVRLPRTWWPSSGFDLQDQMFVYHETTAAWFSLLSSLACPVVNEFALGWWLQDSTYPELLRKRLAMRLELDTTACQPTTSYSGRLFPTLADASSDSINVYIVSEHAIPRSSQGKAIVDLLAQKTPALTHWQDENGIMLCRLDFEHKEKVRLKHVEVFPLLDNERADLVDQISAATVEILS